MTRKEAKEILVWVGEFPLLPWNLSRGEQVLLLMLVAIGASVARIWRLR